MGRRWSEKDIADLEKLAPRCSPQTIAEKLDRSTGAVVFKAHQLNLSLRTRSQESQYTYPADLEGAGFDWAGFERPSGKCGRESVETALVRFGESDPPENAG